MCDACGSEDVELNQFIDSVSKEEYNFCPYCYNSYFGNIHIYPRSYTTEPALARSIAICFNLLEKRLRQ